MEKINKAVRIDLDQDCVNMVEKSIFVKNVVETVYALIGKTSTIVKNVEETESVCMEILGTIVKNVEEMESVNMEKTNGFVKNAVEKLYVTSMEKANTAARIVKKTINS